MPITPAQCRGARGLLGIDQTALASSANVSRNTIVSFERDQRVPGANNLEAIQAALEAAGVIFVPGNGEGPGVRLRKTPAELSEHIADLHETLPVIDEKAKPSPKKAMAQLERAHGKNEIAKATNKKAKDPKAN